jgi:spore maturation protein CgeB
MNLNIVVFGLSITSSWGNGHAVTYRALLRALHERGHTITFLERDVSWYREHRDLSQANYCQVELYKSLKDLPSRFGHLVADADLVILGSYVPDGAMLGEWLTRQARGITAFYDIDTPVTLAQLATGKSDYISAALVPRFDIYLSFTGGPILAQIEDQFASPRARALHCTADLSAEGVSDLRPKWSLGYLGTYSKDRQPALERLLLRPAEQTPDQRFVVAGPQYPDATAWPDNVDRIEHLPPNEHAGFYGRQRFTLNITRADMITAGFSPSVRLFEAAACGVPIITDRWAGLETFFAPGEEILVVDTSEQVAHIIDHMSEERRRGIAASARRRLLRSHTPDHRARQLEEYYREARHGERMLAGAEVVA